MCAICRHTACYNNAKRTHAVLLLTITRTLTLTFDLSTQNHITCWISQVIPYTKFEHFEIISFWVMLRTLVWKCTYWPCDLDLWPLNPETLSLLVYPKVISLYQVLTLWDDSFLSCAADKQTNRQTNSWSRTSYPRRPIKVGVGKLKQYRNINAV